MWPIVRQARYLGRYRQIAQVLGHHGFGYLVEQLGLSNLLSLPSRIVRHSVPDPLSGPERLRQTLIALGPTFVKLGQMLSTRADILPPAFLIELTKLQDTVPPFPSDVAIKIIETELGRPLHTAFQDFCHEPLAAASLGQVHTATLHSGEQVVVKIQRPDIQQTMTLDLAILNDIAALAQERTALGSQYNLVDLAWELSTTLRSELDYRREGRNADRFRKNFSGSTIIHIPTIYWEHTSLRVLTSERLFGVKINDIQQLQENGIDQKSLARNSVELILREIFRDGFFHADPHPGNFFALPNAVIGVVDFGQVVSLDRETINNLLLLLVALTRNDTGGALRAMQHLDILDRRDVTPTLRRDLMRFMDRIVDSPLEEMSAHETNEELLQIIRRHQLRMPVPLALLLKAIVMMEGVGIQLDPHLDTFAVARPYATRALAELASPEAVAKRTWEHVQEVREVATILPRQLSDTLRRLDDGELVLQTRDTEMRRVASALTLASMRIALAVTFMAFIIALGMISVAASLGWSNQFMFIFSLIGSIGATLTGLALLVSIIRRGDP
ncbi:MAG: AarF/ABC1/UbiB kinase family protein [Chloroflexi bacterium AL-W]|nr:AarF/ABC1/UbiB kinase family protein [Chloroflexi bacterium AL-N1]NOK66154.1 AarF/ABC1/UbiB kinase family protein [Chloroflexi bacterium AL-N10]NOK73035.1 AarF/ABC1/UbiB kinase family protein [Chloroflexi bacterium AL-N5]NOK79932.1 AarF/ABC1/UbiB kinase family protein [Chloroflexi bacterium AL-W]NOK88212.1 AarF/ABC1/UbiB kinase family protein [Chloroflexi bacterium AL-N15]